LYSRVNFIGRGNFDYTINILIACEGQFWTRGWCGIGATVTSVYVTLNSISCNALNSITSPYMMVNFDFEMSWIGLIQIK